MNFACRPLGKPCNDAAMRHAVPGYSKTRRSVLALCGGFCRRGPVRRSETQDSSAGSFRRSAGFRDDDYCNSACSLMLDARPARKSCLHRAVRRVSAASSQWCSVRTGRRAENKMSTPGLSIPDIRHLAAECALSRYIACFTTSEYAPLF